MSNYVIYLIILALVSNIHFLFIFLLQKFSKNLSNRSICILLKSMLIYLLVPLFSFVYVFRRFYNVRKVPVYGEDFHYATITKYLTIDMVYKRNARIQLMAGILLSVWLIGFIYSFGYKVLSTYYRLRKLQEVSTVYHNDSVKALTDDILSNFHREKNIEIYKTYGIGSPFILGIKKVKIFLPDITFSETEMKLILRHEFVHYEKGDVLFKNLLLLLQGIYWFNPFIYLFKNYFVELCELACDEEVLCNESKDVRFEYGRLIIKMLEKQAKSYNLVFFADYNDKRIRRRIKEIMLQNKKNSRVLAAVLSVICVFAFPVTSFGVTVGATSLENHIVRKIVEDSTIYEVNDGNYDVKEFTYSANKENSFYLSNQKITRGSNFINCILNGNELYVFDNLYLPKGSTVQYIVASSEDGHEFKAGIMDSEENIVAVSSSNGTVSHTFKITADGDYSLVLQGITHAKMHINGSVVVK